MPRKVEHLQNHENLPPLNKSQIILAVPFYNEEKSLPGFIQAIRKNPTASDRVYIVGVNHRSKDSSEQVFLEATSGYGTIAIVHEKQEIASVGIPRQLGLETALALAKSATKKTVIGSIDTDSRVSSHFLPEAEHFIDTNHDFLLFPTRNDQKQFLECVDLQTSVEAVQGALYTLVGIDWLKYQLRALLLEAGAIETRGSGGYFFTTEGYSKAHGHKPVYSTDGTIVTGESNAVGIRAKRAGATALISPYINTASPRRIFKSLRTAKEGYLLTSSGKTFEVVGSNQAFPVLETEEWQQHFNTMLYGAVRTFVIKTLAYEVVPEIRACVFIPELQELLSIAFEAYSQTSFVGDERDAIGSNAYISLFEQSYEILGKNKQDALLGKVAGLMPDNDTLREWANDESPVIQAAHQLP